MTASNLLAHLNSNLPFVPIEGHPRSNAMELLMWFGISLIIPLLAYGFIDQFDHRDGLWYAVWLIPSGLLLSFLYFLFLVHPFVTLLIALVVVALIVIIMVRKTAKKQRRNSKEQYHS